MTAPYSIFDLAVLRFGISGLVGAAYLWHRRRDLGALSGRDWAASLALAWSGYVGYFLVVAGAARLAGPVLASAVLGLVPVVLALAGNRGRDRVRPAALAGPLALVLAGLGLVDHQAFRAAGLAGAADPALGLILALGAVALWTGFALLNDAVLARRPGLDSALWTAMMLAGGGAQMIAFVPAGLALGVFHAPAVGLAGPAAARLLAWGGALALFGSVGGAWAWTLATRRLPVSLAAQLIVMETVFGAMAGLVVMQRWPTPQEAAGLALLVAGVVGAIRAFQRRPGQGRRPCMA